MSLFPQRSSVHDFLAMYTKLPDDDKGEEEVDLLDSDYEESEDDDDDDDHALQGFVAEDTTNAEDDDKEEEEHKAFDAGLRDAEQEAMEALGRSFEARAAEYMLDDDFRHSSSHSPRLRRASLTAAQKQAADEAAHKAEVEAAAQAAAQDAAKMAAKQAALYALYDLEADDATPGAPGVPTARGVSQGRVGEASGGEVAAARAEAKVATKPTSAPQKSARPHESSQALATAPPAPKAEAATAPPPQERPTKPASEGLPAGWVVEWSKSRARWYFFNTRTKQSSWHRPAVAQERATSQPHAHQPQAHGGGGGGAAARARDERPMQAEVECLFDVGDVDV